MASQSTISRPQLSPLSRSSQRGSNANRAEQASVIAVFVCSLQVVVLFITEKSIEV
jgi:hypothetical protein